MKKFQIFQSSSVIHFCRRHYLIIAIFTIFLITSIIFIIWCNPIIQTESKLNDVESILRKDTSKALATLDSINKSAQKSESTRALHALLTTIAWDISGIDQTNDSLINIAYDYYNNGSDKYHLMLTELYYGRIDYFAKRYTRAIRHLLKSSELADNLQNHLYSGLSYRTLADLHYDNENGPLSIKYYQIAYDRFKQGGEELRPYACHIKLRLLYSTCLNGELEKTCEMARQMLKEDDGSVETWSQGCYHNMSMAEIQLKQYDSAYIHAMKLKDIVNPDKMYESELRNLSLAYTINNELDSAIKYMQLAQAIDSFDNEPKYWIELKRGNLKSSLNEADIIIGKQAKKIRHYVSSIYPLIYQDIQDERLRENRINTKNKILKYISGGCVIIAILLVLIFYYRHQSVKRRLKIMETEATILELNSLTQKHEIQNTQNVKKIAALSSKIENTRRNLKVATHKIDELEQQNKKYNQQLIITRRRLISIFIKSNETLINAIMEPHANADGNEDELYKYNLQILAKLRTQEMLNEWIQQLDTFLDNMISDLFRDLNLKDKTKPLIIYMIMGFSTKIIAFLMDKNEKWVSNTKWRLKEKIEASNLTRRKDYLMLFNN